MSARTTRGFRRVLAAALATATFGAAWLSPALIQGAAAAASVPLVRNDRLTVAPGVAGSVAVLDNDISADGFADVVIEYPPSNGTAWLSSTNVLTYTSAVGYHGGDTLEYSVTDSDQDTEYGSVAITVVQGSPVHADYDEVSGEPDHPLSIDVTANDEASDGISSVSVTEQPASGTAAIVGNRVVYLPAPGFRGSDSLTYRVEDVNGDSDSTRVDITIQHGHGVVADYDGVSTQKNTASDLDVTANDVVPDGIQSVTIDYPAAVGTATVTGHKVHYVPAPGFQGEDFFTYTVLDDDGDSGTGTVSIRIFDGLPVNAHTVAVETAVALTIDVAAHDDQGDRPATVTIASATSMAGGRISMVGNRVRYVPPPSGFRGQDWIWYTIEDSNGDVAYGGVPVLVYGDGHAVHATGDAATVPAGVTTAVDVLGNDDLADGLQTLELTSDASNGNAWVEGNHLFYTPDPGAYYDYLEYRVTDIDGDSAWSWVDITVGSHSVNDPPSAQADSVSTSVGQSVTVAVVTNDTDSDGDTLSLRSVGSPSHGAAVQSGSSLIYTPAPGFSGVDTFAYTVSDGHGGKSLGTVTVVVTPPAAPQVIAQPPPGPALPMRITPTVTAALSKSSAPVKSAVTISGKVSPGAGTTATLQRKSGSSWVDVTATDVAGNGAYSLKVPTVTSGATTYAVNVTGAGINATRSAAKVLSVYSASITKVQAAGAEYVVIKNTGKVAISLHGMKLKDKRGKALTLPTSTVPVGKSVTVFTGKGKSSATKVHLAKKLDVWSKHDTARLTDPFGTTVAQKKY